MSESPETSHFAPESSRSLDGLGVLITGASRGIGRAIAIEFAQKGAHIGLHYHQNQTAALETKDQLAGTGHVLLKADVADAGDVNRMIQKATNRLGRLDVVVNNAGIFHPTPIFDMDYKQWQRDWHQTLSTNLIGPANVCYLAAQVMKDQKVGKIINISSRGAFRGEPCAFSYGASKAGLNSLSQSLAQALAPWGIQVFTIAPGFVETDMVSHLLQGEEGQNIKAQSPLKRAAQPREVARLCLYLASDETEYLTGAIIDINGASYLRN
jgi:NAD(P)-dependent dehydrogenase (short-subunit alcohol dehydrogenase family)